MADLLRIAKERRETLLAEIARLDEFLSMAEALERVGQSTAHAVINASADAHVQPDRGGIPIAIERAGRAASDHTHTARAQHVATEAPRLLLPHYGQVASSTEPDVDATIEGATRAARGTREIRSAFADYIEALRARIEHHFGNARRTPALISSPAVPASSDLAFGNTAAAGPASATSENTTKCHASTIEPSCQQRGAAAHRAHAILPVRERAGPMGDMAASVAELGERRTATAPSFDLRLGQRIRQRRWMLGISQKQLGHRIGVELQKIKECETGREQIDAARLRNIATALEVPVAFFFEGLDGQAPDTGDAQGEVLSEEEARSQLDDIFGDTFVFVTSRSA